MSNSDAFSKYFPKPRWYTYLAYGLMLAAAPLFILSVALYFFHGQYEGLRSYLYACGSVLWFYPSFYFLIVGVRHCSDRITLWSISDEK